MCCKHCQSSFALSQIPLGTVEDTKRLLQKVSDATHGHGAYQSLLKVMHITSLHSTTFAIGYLVSIKYLIMVVPFFRGHIKPSMSARMNIYCSGCVNISAVKFS